MLHNARGVSDEGGTQKKKNFDILRIVAAKNREK